MVGASSSIRRWNSQFELYLINADGGGLRRLTNDPANDGAASWSRDGHSIYFTSNRSREHQIWKMREDGQEAEASNPLMASLFTMPKASKAEPICGGSRLPKSPAAI
jgi:hypothetical protein